MHDACGTEEWMRCFYHKVHTILSAPSDLLEPIYNIIVVAKTDTIHGKDALSVYKHHIDMFV